MTTLVGGGTLPVGTILSFAGPISEIPDGFLACNGASINRNDFAALFSVIGTNWGTVDGLTFNVPTCSGNLLRGRNAGTGADPESATRTAVQTGGSTADNVGSLQTWRVQSHGHSWRFASHDSTVNADANTTINGGVTMGAGNTFKSADGLHIGMAYTSTITVNNDANSSVQGYNGTVRSNAYSNMTINTSNTGNSQTVGRNVYVEFIIKF